MTVIGLKILVHLMGTETGKCFQGGPGLWEDFEKLCKQLISWVILRSFFPSNTHAKFVKFSAVTLKRSSGFLHFYYFLVEVALI